MPYYCVNKNAQPQNGDHEVHDTSSTRACLPVPTNRIALGFHSTCSSAVGEAKKHFDDVNGCFYCVSTCHTT